MFRETKLQIALHRLMALLICYQLIFDGGIGRSFGTAIQAGTTPQFDTGARLHLMVALSVPLLVLPRLIARLHSPEPPEEPGLPGPAARAIHGLLHLMLILIPIIVLNASALYHHIIRKGGLIGRMLPH